MGFDLVKTDKKEFFADIFLPNRCPFCDKVIMWDLYCCDECFENAEWLDSEYPDICRKCGRMICICDTGRVKYDFCCCAGSYDNKLIKKAVLSLKYDHSGNAAAIFARRLAGLLRSDGRDNFDFIVPVPMNKLKELKRGANHSELLAKALSDELHIPVDASLLKKRYSFDSQHSRHRSERERSVYKEYCADSGKSLNGEKILLCDDIMTTGSTINRCSELLKEMGASEITAAVCAETM